MGSQLRIRGTVFPAYAGVFPAPQARTRRRSCLPRIRGGVSPFIVISIALIMSSPHTRGCFLTLRQDCSPIAVFPAYAGVFPPRSLKGLCRRSLPRIRGGVSDIPDTVDADSGSSPHTRGCFFWRDVDRWLTSVFPAYAGVFLTFGRLQIGSGSLPRIRGGVSAAPDVKFRMEASSPHTRGCFSGYLRQERGV